MAKKMAKKIETVSDDPQGEHYTAICALSVEVDAAQQTWLKAKEESKDCKALYDKLSADLLYMITAGPDWQKSLEFGEE